MTCRHVPVMCRKRSPSLSIGWIYSGHSKNWETVKLHQRSISVRPMREKVKSLKHVKLRVDTLKQQETPQLTTIMKTAVSIFMMNRDLLCSVSTMLHPVYCSLSQYVHSARQTLNQHVQHEAFNLT